MQLKALKLLVGLLLCSNIAFAQNFNKDILPRPNHLYIGLGPSFMYADNGGGLRSSNFKIRPAASVSYGRRINYFMEVKGSFGFQMLQSQDAKYFSDSVIRHWQRNDQAMGIKGNAYYVDVMPVFHLPYDRHIDRNNVNLYAGVGLGLMVVDKKETKMVNDALTEESKTLTVSYIPLRAGISYRIGPHSDLALEGTFLATFSDDIDGNVGFNKYNDHLFQGQLVFKRYLSPFPFWKN